MTTDQTRGDTAPARRRRMTAAALLAAAGGLALAAAANAAPNTWVAISFSTANGAFGWTSNYPTQDDAVGASMSQCARFGGGCAIQVVAPNGCAALAVTPVGGDGGFAIPKGGSGPTVAAAEQSALGANGGSQIAIYSCADDSGVVHFGGSTYVVRPGTPVPSPIGTGPVAPSPVLHQ
jgi:Domain of unknown function (DUF4189)